MIPRHSATIGAPVELTQSQPAVASVIARAQASTLAASSFTAPDRSAALNVRAHSPVVAATIGQSGQHAASRAAGSS